MQIGNRGENSFQNVKLALLVKMKLPEISPGERKGGPLRIRLRHPQKCHYTYGLGKKEFKCTRRTRRNKERDAVEQEGSESVAYRASRRSLHVLVQYMYIYEPRRLIMTKTGGFRNKCE